MAKLNFGGPGYSGKIDESEYNRLIFVYSRYQIFPPRLVVDFANLGEDHPYVKKLRELIVEQARTFFELPGHWDEGRILRSGAGKSGSEIHEFWNYIEGFMPYVRRLEPELVEGYRKSEEWYAALTSP